MLRYFSSVLVFAPLFVCAADSAWHYEEKELSGTYGYYGGTLGDMHTPGNHDENMAFQVTGEAAQRMFDAIGPDLGQEESCLDDPADRMRSRRNLVCVKSANGQHACYFGLDLKTGKTLPGISC